MKRVLIAMTLLAMCCGSAFAGVGLEPASGYVHLPDAQVVKTGSIEGFAAYLTTHGTNELGRLTTQAVICDGNGYTLGAVGGIGKGLELGVGYTNIDKAIGTANAFAVAAKWKFVERPESGLAVALGASYRNWNADMHITEPFSDVITIDLPAVTSVYVALDKAFKPSVGSQCIVSGTIGVIYDNYSSSHQSTLSGNPFSGFDVPVSLDGVVASDSFVSPFIGLRADAPKWSVLGEFRPALEKSGFSYQSILWSLAVSGKIGESSTASVGVSTFNLPYTRSTPAFFFELTHKFGR